MKESEVLAEVSNENQTLVAVVQQDLRVVILYLPARSIRRALPSPCLLGEKSGCRASVNR